MSQEKPEDAPAPDTSGLTDAPTSPPDKAAPNKAGPGQDVAGFGQDAAQPGRGSQPVVGWAPGAPGSSAVGASQPAMSELSAVRMPAMSNIGGPPHVGGAPPAGDVWAPPPVGVRPAGTGWRAPWWLVVVLVVVAAGAGIGAGAWIWAGQVEKVYPPGVQAMTPEQYDKCMRGMTISFSGGGGSGTDGPNPTMRAAADKLRQDERIESVREETQQQAYDRFKEVFKDQPDLVDATRPEALPASVNVMVRRGTTAKQLKNAMQEEFPDADITVQNWCPPPE